MPFSIKKSVARLNISFIVNIFTPLSMIFGSSPSVDDLISRLLSLLLEIVDGLLRLNELHAHDVYEIEKVRCRDLIAPADLLCELSSDQRLEQMRRQLGINALLTAQVQFDQEVDCHELERGILDKEFLFAEEIIKCFDAANERRHISFDLLLDVECRMRDGVWILPIDVKDVGNANISLCTAQRTEHENHVFDTPRGGELDLIFDQEISTEQFIARPPKITLLTEVDHALSNVVCLDGELVDEGSTLIALHDHLCLGVDLIAGARRQEEPLDVNDIGIGLLGGVIENLEPMTRNEIIGINERDVLAPRKFQCLIARDGSTSGVLMQFE